MAGAAALETHCSKDHRLFDLGFDLVPSRSAASVCDRQGFALERLQRDLLRQHDIPGCDTIRRKTPRAGLLAISVQLLDIENVSPIDPIALAGIGAHDLEKPANVVLLALAKGEPRTQELLRRF